MRTLWDGRMNSGDGQHCGMNRPVRGTNGAAIDSAANADHAAPEVGATGRFNDRGNVVGACNRVLLGWARIAGANRPGRGLTRTGRSVRITHNMAISRHPPEMPSVT